MDQRADRLINLVRHRPMAFLQLAMLIPGIRRATRADSFGQTRKLDEAHALLNEPPRQQRLTRVSRLFRMRIVEAVHLFRRLTLIAEVADSRHCVLHLERRFVVLDRRLDLRVRASSCCEIAINLIHKIEPRPLDLFRLAWLNVRDRRRLVGLNDRSLVLGRQKPVREEPDAAVRRNRAAALEHNVARQVFIRRP